MRSKLKFSAAALGSLLWITLPHGGALAQDIPSDLDLSVLAQTCANCHGTDGRSPGDIPSLAGKDFDHLLQRLVAFKAGEAKDATVMTRHATGYTDGELEALARYFSEIEP